MSRARHTDVLLIYPPLGCWDGLIKDIPLSLLYAAADSVRAGYTVRVLDLRVEPGDWRQATSLILEQGCALVGLSVMTGKPIENALEISRFIKDAYPTVPIVWGGPHPTILPEQTLEDPAIDYIVRDWGSAPLRSLLDLLSGDLDRVSSIRGLGYKDSGRVVLNPPQREFERVKHGDLPYHLIDRNLPSYTRFNSAAVIFPIFTSLGCPHQCSFCIAPGQYNKVRGKRWIPLDVTEVLDHIQFLVDRYDLRELQVYDDDSFVDLERMRTFFQGYISRRFHERIVLDFRGVRVDEVDRMDDGLLSLMVEANVNLLFIGLESGSDEVLGRLKKGITREQILRVNRKLARYPRLKPRYSYFCGVPGESYEDLLLTKSLLLQVVREHPGCYLGAGSDWKPIPGSELTDVAVSEYGLALPGSLAEWSKVDSFDAEKIYHPWYTDKYDGMIKLLQVFANTSDSKLRDFRGKMGLLGSLLYRASRLYQPVLSFRLRHNLTAMLAEYHLQLFIHNQLGNILGLSPGRGRAAS